MTTPTIPQLPPQLRRRLDDLPRGLRDHVHRVRAIARELAAAHGVDPGRADLAAAAHDVARATPPRRLLEEAERLGLTVHPVEAHSPVLLHGPVGAGWLRQEGALTDPEALEGVRWHSTAHPDLALLGQVVFLADKLDPKKASRFPFQEEVQEAAFRSLRAGMLAFLNGVLAQHLRRGELIHPAAMDARNALLLGGAH